jgi:hypothetical protein
MPGTFGRSSSRDDRLRVGSFGGRYGSVAEGGVGSTRNSSSIWMTIVGTASVTTTNDPRACAFATGSARVTRICRLQCDIFSIFLTVPKCFLTKLGTHFLVLKLRYLRPKSSRRTMQGRRALLLEFGVPETGPRGDGGHGRTTTVPGFMTETIEQAVRAGEVLILRSADFCGPVCPSPLWIEG